MSDSLRQTGQNSANVHIRGIALMYHRILKLDYDPRRMCVSPEHFEEHVRVIKKFGRAVQMRDLAVDLQNKVPGNLEMAITLDDGYNDSARYAKPILEKNAVPATFFIISGAIGSKAEFFRDSLEQVILAARSLPERLEITLGEKHCNWKIKPEGPCPEVDYSEPAADPAEIQEALSRSGLYRTLTPLLSVMTFEGQMEILRQLADWATIDLRTRPEYLPLTEEELGELAGCPLFEMGAHTVHHPVLTRLSAGDQRHEIGNCKMALERMTGRPIESFSYPHGEYDQETVEIIKRLNYRSACTVRARPVKSDTDPFLLPRFMPLDWDGDQFERQLRRWLSMD